VAQGAFGSAVCIDTDGAQTRLVVGASGEQLGGVKSGRAYVFRQSGDEWVLEASLQPDGIPTDNDGFGRAVSIRSDWAFVGAAFEDSAAVNGGAVFVYRRAESGWVLWQKLTSPNPTALGEYGASLGFDGQTLVVGAPRESTGGVVEGCVHVLRFDGAEWVEVAILRSPSPGEP
jgi:hypothetical protein